MNMYKASFETEQLKNPYTNSVYYNNFKKYIQEKNENTFFTKKIFFLLHNYDHETTDCYISEHLNITRLSKRCNDKINIFKYSFFSENPAKTHKII